MADPLLADLPPKPNPRDHDEALAIPPMDPLFFASQEDGICCDFAADLPLDNYDFDLTFDDVNVDDLFEAAADVCFDNFALDLPLAESLESEVSHDGGPDPESFLNSSLFGDGSCDSGSNSVAVVKSGSPVSSHGSGNAGTIVMNVPSPDSDNFVVDQKVKVEEGGGSKRKNEGFENFDGGEVRSQKCRRSGDDGAKTTLENLSSQCGSGSSGEEEKRKARLIRNRESAQLSRQRKKHYVEELEDKVRAMHSTIADLNGKISFFMAENASLKQQLGSNGMCPAPMYPGPIAYPWMPCQPYMVKPQGSQVPLVPIPRLRPQKPVPAAKSSKGDGEKAKGRTKKVASVSFLGLLLFVMFFGGLVPYMKVNYGGFGGDSNYGVGTNGERLYDEYRGRVLIVKGHLNVSQETTGFSNAGLDIGSKIHCQRCSGHQHDTKVGSTIPASDESSLWGNGSEPLFASLYVPRNDKLVKIDGNLIIHSILASEKARASHNSSDGTINKQKDKIPGDLAHALAIPDASEHPHLYQTTERPKALPYGSYSTLKDHMKSSAADGKLQQWFREGIAGPMLSSGMCTEVFRFDVSPSSGAIIPFSSAANITRKGQSNTTASNRVRNRRTLHGLPVPLPGANANFSRENVGGTSQNNSNFKGNKPGSSTVVSVLIDPRETSEIEVDGRIRSKALSRVFVVVLLDSVKYVTYSCMLPQLVTT